MEAVFCNPVIVRNICFFIPEDYYLINLRLVNRRFHDEATRRLRVVHILTPVNLKQESSVDEFLARMRNRIDTGNPHTFPFTAFTLALSNSEDSLERLAEEVGQHIRRLKVNYVSYRDGTRHQLQRKVVLVLSGTPNLTAFYIETCESFQIQNRSLSALPNSFPHLKVIHVDYLTETSNEPDSVSLLSLLITRATTGLHELGKLRIKNTLNDNAGLDALRSLAQCNKKDNAPIVENLRMDLYDGPLTLPILQELTKYLPWLRKLRKLMLYLGFRTDTQPWSPNLIFAVSGLLTTLSSNLEFLCLEFKGRELEENATFPIPVFKALKSVHFMLDLGWGSGPFSKFSLPLSQKSFPALQTLHLDMTWIKNIFVNFWGSPLPSVEVLNASCSSSLLNTNPWHRILPNLRSIDLTTSSDSRTFEEQNLTYILTHFPRITSLRIRLSRFRNSNYNLDLWDILTGGAPKPISRDVLFREHMSRGNALFPEPVDGIYSVPSLGNLRALQTLSFCPTSRSNLDAILYMTRINLLGPLTLLHLMFTKEDLKMNDEEYMVYRDILSYVHTRIVIDGS